MDITLMPRPIGGTIAAIASKSQAHRMLICAALAHGTTTILCRERSADIDATVACLRALGADISYADGVYRVCPIAVPPKEAVLDCGESGSTLRFLLPVAAALGGKTIFRLHGRLPQRPLSPLWEELETHGCRLSRPRADTICCEGKLYGGLFHIPGNISSQFISGLLFALPLVGEDSDIMLTSPVESGSYISMTLEALNAFGVSIAQRQNGWHIEKNHHYHATGHCTVEGDWSNAAFWLCAGAISHPVTMTGLSADSPQGDQKILSVLESFGAQVQWNGAAVTVSPRPLHGIDLDVSDIPDLVPPIALVAATARGTTVIRGAARLRIKESDRLQTVAQTLNDLGGSVTITADGLIIHGGALRGGEVSSSNDHRIAMLAAIASAVCSQPVTIHGAEAVNKSYPRFWEDHRKMQREETL